MSGDHRRPPPTVDVGRQEVHAGGTGVVVRMDGRDSRPRSNVRTTEGEPIFTGRDDELRAIEDALQDRRIIVLHGAPGLGKSRLAREYAHKHVADYPGGMFFVPFEPPPPTELARLLRDMGRPTYPEEPVEDQCRRSLRELGAAGRALVIYDAIADERMLRQWLPYDGLDWHLVVTSTSASWASSWTTLEIGSLRDDAARALVEAILADQSASDRLARPIITKAAGITIELCASAAAAYERLRRKRTVESVSAELAVETTSSFEAAWTLLSRDAQIALRLACELVAPHIPELLLVSTLQRMQWTATAAERAIDEAHDRRLTSASGGRVEVHQLVARFARNREPLAEPVRRSLFQGLLATAEAFVESPGNLDHRTWLLTHSLELDDWDDLVVDWSQWHALGTAITELGRFEAALPWCERAVAAAAVDSERLGTSLHQVACCYGSLGRFDDALRCFERAIAAKENGDAHGRVDFASLGSSLHQLGGCYSSLERSTEALAWYERAVAAKQKGDVSGRVDSASLGTSIHQLGSCCVALGKLGEALQWYERAVAAKQAGDARGQVDLASIGGSLHQVGYCHVQLGNVDQALSWYERAVTAKQNGDTWGRVDFASLGKSLDQVGYCYWRVNNLAEALRWYERAVVEKQKGDLHGRVDSASLGTSFHHIAACYARMDKLEDAVRWFQRAVDEREKGDLHGRVDIAGLGTSLYETGYCYTRLGKDGEARRWYQRAVAAAENAGPETRSSTSAALSRRQLDDCDAHLRSANEDPQCGEHAVIAHDDGHRSDA